MPLLQMLPLCIENTAREIKGALGNNTRPACSCTIHGHEQIETLSKKRRRMLDESAEVATAAHTLRSYVTNDPCSLADGIGTTPLRSLRRSREEEHHSNRRILPRPNNTIWSSPTGPAGTALLAISHRTRSLRSPTPATNSARRPPKGGQKRTGILEVRRTASRQSSSSTRATPLPSTSAHLEPEPGTLDKFADLTPSTVSQTGPASGTTTLPSETDCFNDTPAGPDSINTSNPSSSNSRSSTVDNSGFSTERLTQELQFSPTGLPSLVMVTHPAKVVKSRLPTRGMRSTKHPSSESKPMSLKQLLSVSVAVRTVFVTDLYIIPDIFGLTARRGQTLHTA